MQQCSGSATHPFGSCNNRPMDRFLAMEAFSSVADLRGFSPAARKLGVSPSMVTRLVASLEEHLGVRLLTRTTRTVSLTEAGRRYLERTRAVLGGLVEAESAARHEQATPRGRFVVTAPAVFGRLNVVPLMSDFLAAYPEIEGELTLSDRVVSLVEDHVDVAVRIGHLEDSTLRSRVVGSTRRVLVASPEYLKRKKRPRKPDDLASHATIAFSALTPMSEWRFAGKPPRRPIAVKPSLVTNSADAAVTHAARGGGIALVLAYQAAAAIRAGELEIVLASFEPPPIPIQLVYPGGAFPSAAVRAFVELTVSTRAWSFVDL